MTQAKPSGRSTVKLNPNSKIIPKKAANNAANAKRKSEVVAKKKELIKEVSSDEYASESDDKADKVLKTYKRGEELDGTKRPSSGKSDKSNSRASNKSAKSRSGSNDGSEFEVGGPMYYEIKEKLEEKVGKVYNDNLPSRKTD